ncbi:BnaA03g54740D [Brassica napus]|uniref:BnaA03g54740D protein n=1 Tax=Brassica napus TaxID=3708 RepID=A0A078H5V9_BRANA|nr:BnaA03g54740D [Brassica napus]
MKDTTKKTVPTGSTSKREHSTKNNETIANNENSAILSQANIVSTQSTINSATTNSQIPPISLSSRSIAQRLRYKRKRTTNSIEGEVMVLSDITNQVPSGTTHTRQSYLTATHDERTIANTRIHSTTSPTGTKTDYQVKGNPCASAKRLRKNDSFSSHSNLHTPPTSFPTSSIPLSDTTDVSPSLKKKEKEKLLPLKKKSKTVHATETEGIGFHGDGYSSEENDESIYHDYEGAYEVNGEQHYDCSSEESDMESESNVNFDIESDTVGPSKRKTSSKGKNIYIDEGDATHKCEHCGAIMWYGERINRKRYARKPKFSMCWGHGQVQLPLLKESPAILKRFLTEDDEMSRYFRENIRVINMVFSFTSLGGKVDRSVKKGIGPQMFQLQGENYHLMGSLKPPNGEPKFGQLYIVDTENEIVNRSGILG